jgi:hypothetical protein
LDPPPSVESSWLIHRCREIGSLRRHVDDSFVASPADMAADMGMFPELLGFEQNVCFFTHGS